MEGSTASSSTGTGGSRWSPTKEQISMLEGLYMQGLRTPTAQQIQHITDKLRVYGHIEGKNVFYWFQNHKARQRQKHKQDQIAIAHFNRFLHIFPPTLFNNNQNGESDLGFYCSKVQFRPTHEDEGLKVKRMMAENINGKRKEGEGFSVNSNNKETLDLFPVHPTGILQEKTPSPNYIADQKNSTTNNCISGSPFFDFFAGTATCEDH